MQPLAMSVDIVREFAVLPGARGQNFSPHSLKERLNFSGNAGGVGGVFVAVQQKHPLVSHIRQDEISFALRICRVRRASPNDGASALARQATCCSRRIASTRCGLRGRTFRLRELDTPYLNSKRVLQDNL